MHVSIDESSSFTIPKGDPAPAVSCAGAVLVASEDAEAVVADFTALAAPWADASGEVKGRALGEAEIDAFLADRNYLVECTAIDLVCECYRAAGREFARLLKPPG